MAAPSPGDPTAQAPEGISLGDGYQTLIHIASDPDISLWEKSVTPPGVEGGDPVETTTMRNTLWRTMRPRHLQTMTPMPFTGAYDPNVYDDILTVLNIDTTITVQFPDGSTLAFYGFVQTFEPAELTEGAQPEATVTIVPTNWDPVNNVEAGPAMAEVSGT